MRDPEARGARELPWYDGVGNDGWADKVIFDVNC